ncbi:MAG: kelch repeat-containing protein, partial [Byssovorax sp.]
MASKAVQPDLVCVEQLTTEVILSGDGFTPMPIKTLNTTQLQLPHVVLDRKQDLAGAAASGKATIADDPAAPAKSLVHWTSEQRMSFKVTPEQKLVPGLYDVIVTNPDEHHAATFAGGLAAVPRPTLAGTAPDVLCDAEEDQTVVLTGSGILQVGATLPVVHVADKSFTATKADGCTPVPGKHAEGDIESCTSATFIIPKGTFQPGVYDVTLTNPAPANCVSSDKIAITVVPPPTVAAIAPDLACDAQGDQTMTLTGTGFLTNATLSPTVTLGDKTFIPKTVTGCVAVPGQLTEGALMSCTSITFVIPLGTFPEGDYPVVVTNPKPADCKSLEMVVLHIAPPPSVTSITPTPICDAQGDQTVDVAGTGFLHVGTTLPTVTVGTLKLTPTQATGCAAVKGTFTEGVVEECTGLMVTIAKNALPQGDFAVVVTNPLPADCASIEDVKLHVDDPPVVLSVIPSTICAGGGAITVNGSGFLPATTVSLEAMGLATLTSASTMVNAAGTQVSATFGGGTMVGSVYDVIVSSGDGCTDTAPHKQVTVVPGPIAFFADPEVVFNGVNTRVTVYATTLTLPLPANAVSIVPAGQAAPITMLTWTAVPNHPNRVQVVVPKGQAPGVYDLIMNDATGCSTILPNAVTVTADLTVTVKSIIPPFGFTGSETSVNILRDKAAPAPANKPFIATPRVFLNPSNPLPSDIAIQVESVSFLDDATLTAVVPKNEPAHVYDLIVVNPDGSVGLLTDAFTVQSVAPPTIATVAPSSIVNATGQVVKITGKNFSGSTVSLSCVDAAGNPIAAPPVTFGADVCDAAQNCTQSATINATALPVGAICVLRSTNTDGSYFDYSAIGVTNSSLNLPGTHVGTSLNVGRRALISSAGNATPSARFIYAVGGDGGAAMANAPFNSTEVASVDLFGNMGAWKLQPASTLGSPRSFAASATVGRYIYVAGGSDGTSAIATAERAMILNPQEVPSMDIDDLIPAAVGLDPGYWFYRISATFTPGDLDNPGGESLASDEFIVKVPSFVGKKIKVALAWTAPVDSLGAPLPGVAGYDIYRTPIVNGTSGGEVLLASVGTATLKYTDDGSAVPGTQTPLPLGSTGKWAPMPAMAIARSGAAGASAFDPATPTKLYFYSLLGLNQANQAQTSYEYLPVTILPNGHQTAAASWTTGALASATGRWQLNAWIADSSVSATIAATDTYVYLGGGLLANNTPAGVVEAGKVLVGGDLGPIANTPKDFTSTLAGYGVCAANGQLFAFGGAGGAPSGGAKSATLIAPPPTLAN